MRSLVVKHANVAQQASDRPTETFHHIRMPVYDGRTAAAYDGW